MWQNTFDMLQQAHGGEVVEGIKIIITCLLLL